MSDWFSTAIEMQREILRAQRAQVEAGRQALNTAEPLIAVQEATAKAAEANMAAWQAWIQFWSGKR